MQPLKPFSGLQVHLFGVLTAGPHRVDALSKKFTATPAAINRALHGLQVAGIVQLDSRSGRLWAALVPDASMPTDLESPFIPAYLLKPSR